MNVLTIASLTLREAARRRVFAAVGFLTLAAVAMTAWALLKLHDTMLQHGAGPYQIVGAFAILVLFMAYMFSTMLGAGSAFIAAPAIASDVDSGVMLAMLPRPIRRSDVVIGKWLALVLLAVCYTALVGALEFAVIRGISGYVPPHPARALAYLAGEAVVLLTLALFLGTRLSPIAAAIVAVVAFGIGWLGGVAQSIALALHNDVLVHATTVLGLVLPTDALWRTAAFALEPAAIAASALTDGGRQSPFSVGSPPPLAFTWWAAGWVAVTLGAAVVSFARRDL